jgi:hypothetical protein
LRDEDYGRPPNNKPGQHGKFDGLRSIFNSIKWLYRIDEEHLGAVPMSYSFRVAIDALSQAGVGSREVKGGKYPVQRLAGAHEPRPL